MAVYSRWPTHLVQEEVDQLEPLVHQLMMRDISQARNKELLTQMLLELPVQLAAAKAVLDKRRRCHRIGIAFASLGGALLLLKVCVCVRGGVVCIHIGPVVQCVPCASLSRGSASPSRSRIRCRPRVGQKKRAASNSHRARLAIVTRY